MSAFPSYHADPDAQDPFTIPGDFMNLFSPEEQTSKGSARTQPVKEIPKKRQRSPELVSQDKSYEQGQVTSLLQELINTIARNRQIDNARWQQTCQMLQHLKQRQEKGFSDLLHLLTSRKEDSKKIAQAIRDSLTQLD